MRYDDASGAFQASGPIANDDADTLSAGQRGPATGNLITGEGTQYGAAGADSAAGAHITAIAGKGGEDSSFSGGKLTVTGEHGSLTVDADGNYSYLASGNVENVRDRFTYTLADNQGNSDTAALIVEIGKTPAVIKADAQQIVPGPDGVVTLPPGVELSDVHVVGRNLVVDLPDGTQLVIIDGAVFVPQLVLDGVEVPATNVAALLIGQEVQPAAGEIPPSGGGNFALPPPPLDPGIPLGDLIPPTELDYIPPEPEEVLDTLNEEPEIFIQPDGQPASVNAVDSVDERGLPTRNEGEPEGSGEEAAAGADGDPSEATAGTIIINSPDGVGSVTINGVLVTGVVGQEIDGDFGTLTITGFDGDNILYSYVLNDNTSGDDTQDDFEVILTEDDGDTATATLTIDIIDDVPTARPDTDAIAAGEFGPVTGNVLTDASAGDAGDSDSGADTVGADDAELTSVTGAGSTTPFEGGFTVNGQYGVLTINVDGSYSYTRNEGTPGGVNDVFNYTLTDGDGDTSTTTLTISIGDLPPSLNVPTQQDAGTLVFERGLPTRNGDEPAGSGESADGNGADNDDPSERTDGTITFSPGDGPATVTINGIVITGAGQTIDGDFGTLTIDSYDPSGTITYHYVLADNTSGDATHDDFAVVVTDQDGDTASGVGVINIVDDVPTAADDTDLVPAGTFGPATGNVITDAAAGDAGDSDTGADTVGADNATISGLASVNVPANVDNESAGGFVVNGQYGVLTMQADGSYSYVRNPGTPGGVEDVFTYTLTDGDGDVDTATLTIGIADSPVTLDAPNEGEAGTVVDEKGLPTRDGEPAGSGESADGNGADNDDASETTAGTITYTAPDGPATITIDGVAVTSVGQTFTGSFGTLTITSIANGSIGYSYTLADNTSGDATSDDFALQVIDQDGDVADDTLVIDIIDDVPTAVDDTDSITTGGTEATGNVITDASAGDAGDGDDGADTVGADDASVSGVSSNNVPANSDNDPAGGFVVAGQFGTLTMQADGSYSYVRFDGASGTFQDVFTYTLTDGDGDSDTATLTIDISDAPTTLDVPTQGEAGTLVSEVGLPTRNGGEPAGSGEAADGNGADNDDASETTAGVISFTAPDSPATVTIDGVVVTGVVGQTFNGAHGVLTITSFNAATGQIGYSYTLADNTSGNATFDDFAVVVTDVDGDSSNATLTINIVDDVPTAVNDTDDIATGGTEATGNVITDASAGDAGDGDDGADTVGADNASVSGVSSNNVPANSDNDPAGGFVVAGQFGTLTMQADGSYSYVRFDGTPGNVQDVFTYTLTDGDGDSDTATLTINIEDAAPTLPDPAAVLLDDDALAGGNAGGTDDDVDSQGTPGQLVGSGGDGDLDYNFTGLDTLPAGFTVNSVNAGQIQILQGATVVLTVTLDNETGAYTVVQNNPIDHAAGLDENDVQFSIGVEVQDADGDSEPATITINVDDDTPVAANDTDNIELGGDTATGNVITDASAGDAGDTDDGADSVGADGGAAIVGLASNNVPANVDNDPAGGFVVAGAFGTLTMQADGSYSYVRADGSPGNVQDVFTYTLTDADGDTTTATLTIGIEDAAPTLPDPAAVLLDDDALAGGNAGGTDDDVNSQGTPGQLVGAGGDGDLDYNFTGLDTLPAGFSVNTVNAGQIQILQGATVVLTVTLDNETGSYNVVQNNPIDHPAGSDENNLSFSIGVEVEDADGDTEPATITINVDDDTPVAANDTDSITQGSNGPATGNVITDAAAGDAGDGDTGADSAGADGGAAIVGVASNNVPANVDNDPAGGFVVAGQFGTLTMQADGSYSYLRNDGQGAGQNEVFTYTLTDADGDTTTATLTIGIADATPTLPDPAAVLLDDDALAGGNAGGTDDDVNSQGTPGQLVGSGGDGDLDYAFTGIDTLPAGFSVNVVNAGQIQILQGATVVLTVTLDTETGAYSVVQNNPIDHPAGSDENNLSFGIGVQVVDVDGDAEPATITINVDDDTPVAANDTDTITAGSLGPATGNVITDAAAGDAGDSDTGADSVGADGGAAIVGLASNNVPANIDNDATGGFVVAGQYGTLTMQADGNYSYARTAGTPGGVNDVFTYTLTDADGDTTTATLTIDIANATPTLPDPAAVLLDDDALTNGNPGGTDDDVDSQGTPGTLLGTGGDGDLDYGFTGTNTLPAGFTVNTVNAGQIQILQGATVVLTVTLNTETGGYTVVQNNPIDHAAGLDENNVSFGIGVQVVDVDGDVEPATITINVDDDTPVAIQPAAASLENEIGASDTADLDDDSEVITDFGADGPGLVQFANIGPDGHPSGLTSNEDPIEYWLSNDGQTLQARTNSTDGTDGELIFTVQINQASGDYTVTMTGTIDNGAGVTFNNLTSTKAGNVDVRGVGADDPLTTVDLLLTASANGSNATINTSSSTVGSANQSMNSGETVRIDFVTNLQDDPADDLGTFPSGFSYDGHVGTNSYLQLIPQVGANQAQTVAFRVYALDTTVTDAESPDDTPVAGPTPFSDSTTVAITHVTIDGYNDGPDDGTPNEPAVTVALGPVGTWTTIAYGVSARLESDGSVTFSGVQQGDRYGIETGTDFNAVAISSLPSGVGPAGNGSTADSFDLGVFSIGQVDTGDPIDISFDLSITDADGDTVTMPGAIDITFEPATEGMAPLSTKGFSAPAANDDYSSLLAGDTGQKLTAYGNGFGNVGNTGITSAMVAASGLAALSMSSMDSFSQPSVDTLVHEGFQQLSTRTIGRESLDEGLASISFGNEAGGTAVDAVNLSSSGFSFDDQGFGDRGLDAMSFGDAEPSYVPSYASGEPTVANIPAFAANVPSVSMASAEMLTAASLEGNVPQGGAVEQILADALGHQAPTIDGVLANLPGAIAELGAIANLASPDGAGVPAWDMGMQGGFVPVHDMLMKVAAVTVHQDAVQPA